MGTLQVMAHIEKRGSGRYRVAWRDLSGAKRSKTFKRRADAVQHRAKVESSLVDGSYVDCASRTTFRAWAEQWLATQIHRESTAARVGSDLRVHILPVLGDLRLVAVLPSHIRSAVKRWGTTLAPSSVANVLQLTSAIFSDAVNDRLLVRNPCSGITVRLTRSEVVIPSTVEVERLLEAMPDKYRIAGVLAAGAGLRQGEALGLTVDRIDFAHRTVSVDRQMVTPPTGQPDFGPPKSCTRTIPLGSWVLAAIGEHVGKYQLGPSDLLVTYVDGRPVRKTRFGYMWRQSCARADLDFRFHDLRHYFASVLLDSCSIVAVQRAMGHASAKVTLDVYGHLLPTADEATRAAIDAAFSRAGESAVAMGNRLQSTDVTRNGPLPGTLGRRPFSTK